MDVLGSVGGAIERWFGAPTGLKKATYTIHENEVFFSIGEQLFKAPIHVIDQNTYDLLSPKMLCNTALILSQDNRLFTRYTTDTESVQEGEVEALLSHIGTLQFLDAPPLIPEGCEVVGDCVCKENAQEFRAIIFYKFEGGEWVSSTAQMDEFCILEEPKIKRAASGVLYSIEDKMVTIGTVEEGSDNLIPHLKAPLISSMPEQAVVDTEAMMGKTGFIMQHGKLMEITMKNFQPVVEEVSTEVYQLNAKDIVSDIPVQDITQVQDRCFRVIGGKGIVKDRGVINTFPIAGNWDDGDSDYLNPNFGNNAVALVYAPQKGFCVLATNDSRVCVFSIKSYKDDWLGYDWMVRLPFITQGDLVKTSHPPEIDIEPYNESYVKELQVGEIYVGKVDNKDFPLKVAYQGKNELHQIPIRMVAEKDMDLYRFLADNPVGTAYFFWDPTEKGDPLKVLVRSKKSFGVFPFKEKIAILSEKNKIKGSVVSNFLNI